MTYNGRVFEMECEPIDVTSVNRPDTSWALIDAAGHQHCWYANGAPAGPYNPQTTYELPTLKWVVDDEWIDEDGYERTSGHHECVQCGEHINPRCTADAWRQTIPGMARYYINGDRVTEEVFKRESGQ